MNVAFGAAMGKVTIVLADDHPVVRVGLRTLLEREEGLSVVGESSSGKQTVELTKDLKPDVLFLT